MTFAFRRALLVLIVVVCLINAYFNRWVTKKTLESKPKPPISLGSSGKIFTGEKIRKYPYAKTKYLQMASTVKTNKRLECAKWAVLTTIFPPSEALRRFTYKSDWCVVVIGDIANPPEPFNYNSDMSDNVIFLNAASQTAISGEFVDALPWNSFSRKNIGYLFALAHGAQVIWDFDDDNMLKFWLKDAATEKRLSLDFFADKGENQFINREWV